MVIIGKINMRIMMLRENKVQPSFSNVYRAFLRTSLVKKSKSQPTVERNRGSTLSSFGQARFLIHLDEHRRMYHYLKRVHLLLPLGEGKVLAMIAKSPCCNFYWHATATNHSNLLK
jgi:hypothetical protein